MNLRRSSIVALAAGALVLTACGDAAPPGRELAVEMIDTLDQPDDVKACMRQEVADFRIEEEGFEDFDDVTAKAADGQPLAQEIVERFNQALEACTRAG